MGALQARPPHRPYSGRRSAGHQCRPMGDRRCARRRIFLRESAPPTRAGGPCSWSAISSRRSSASRAPTRASSRRCAGRPRESGIASRRRERDEAERIALEFRDLSIDASFRSAPAILEVVDAVIDEVGPGAWGLPERPNPHRRASCRPSGPCTLWRAFATDDAANDNDDEEGWIAPADRLYASRSPGRSDAGSTKRRCSPRPAAR